jgi:2-hydroxy-6-oxonona-2,4-dienedioate hydrolase
MVGDARSFFGAVAGIPLNVSWQHIDGVDTRVLDIVGERLAPIVCLHGTGAHAESYIYNLAALSRLGRVIAYDLPAHGWSSAPERSYEVGAYCHHLERLVDALGLDRVTLVGHSLGAWIAVRFALAHPARVEALILVAPAGVTANPTVSSEFTAASRAAAADPTTQNVRRRLELMMNDPQRVTDELVELRQMIYTQSGAADRMERILCLQDPAVRARNLLTEDELRSLSRPTLVVAGQNDRLVPLEDATMVAGAVPLGELRIMRASGHWPQFEQPRNVNECATAFFTGLGSPTHNHALGWD